MLKRLLVIVAVAAFWGCLWGCDELVTDGVSPDIEKLIPAAKAFQGGTATGDQVRQRDQLRDGTGAYCPDGNPNARQGQGGQGNGDQLRLRDGTCLQ